MSRGTRTVLLRIGSALAALIVIAAIGAIVVVQTDWFRNYVTQKIIAAAEQATGGRVEIASFRFDWRHLQADVSDFVIHGTEPAGEAPFLRAPQVQVRIRLFTSIHHLLDVTYLGIDRLQANIVVTADGRSNIPSPKPEPGSGKPPLQSIVNAAIGRFDLNNATVVFADARQMLDLHANNFRAQLSYKALPSTYQGEVSFQPLYVASGRNTPVNITMTLPVSLQSDRVSLNGATIATEHSNLRIDGSVEDLRNPKVSAHVGGQIALADLKNLGDLPLELGTRGVPSAVSLDAEGIVSGNLIRSDPPETGRGPDKCGGVGRSQRLGRGAAISGVGGIGRSRTVNRHGVARGSGGIERRRKTGWAGRDLERPSSGRIRRGAERRCVAAGF